VKSAVGRCATAFAVSRLLLSINPQTTYTPNRWLAGKLFKTYKGSVVAITTMNRYFLDISPEWILNCLMERRALEGNYSSWLVTPKAGTSGVTKKAEGQRRKTLSAQLEWVRNGAPADGNRKAKLECGHILDLLAQEPARSSAWPYLEIYIRRGPRTRDPRHIQADGIAKAYAKLCLYESLLFQSPPAAIVGIIGPQRRRERQQLFRMICRAGEPDKEGPCRVGERGLTFGYVLSIARPHWIYEDGLGRALRRGWIRFLPR